MQRDCLEKIAEWNNSRKRKPLVLMGARQVGKTWLMEEFAKQSYPGKHVVVNFMRQRSLSDSIQESDIDPQKLIRLIQTATGQRVIPGETLLILDELQECPRALTSLKFFNEDMPELAVMAAGSLLGLAWGKSNGDKPQAGDSDAVYSFPVGKVNRLNVYPMTFAEFLKANGKGALVDVIAEGDWDTVRLLSGEYESLLKSYFVVGGMPAAVVDWVETGVLAEVRKIQREILADYDDDFKKHAPKDLLPKIRLLWDNIPSQLAKENNKFVYNALKPGARAREYEVALEWLKDAGMIHIQHRVCPPNLPLAHYMDLSAFKLFAHDVGLLGAMSDLDPKVVLNGNDVFTNFKGALTEQFVLQELLAMGVVNGYWTPAGGESELDFVVQAANGVYPLEVKSATNTKAKSLGVYMREYTPALAFKSSLKNYSESRDVKSIPLYALGIALPPMLVLGRSTPLARS